MTTISDDKFIETIVSSANREVHELAEEHIIFPGPDPQVLIHIWHENGCYFSGISERSYNPRGAVRANDLTGSSELSVGDRVLVGGCG